MGESTHAGKNLNGKNLNGKNLNGKNLNGSSLGTAIEWTSKAGASLHGQALQNVTLDGSELVGTRLGAEVRGSGLLHAQFVAESDTGQSLSLRVVGVSSPPSGSDIWRYDVEYLDPVDGWSPICSDSGGDYLATAVEGYWNRDSGVSGGGAKVADSSKFTFACAVIGAVGKCVDIGYRPWASSGGTSLDGPHQACVRALRADYCGDGTSYTTDGTVINLYDDLGIQVDTETWTVEGEWDASGALCMSGQIHRGSGSVPCETALIDQSCGDTAHFDDGTWLMTELE